MKRFKRKNNLDSYLENDDIQLYMKEIENEIFSELKKHREFNAVKRVTIDSSQYFEWVSSDEIGTGADDGFEIDVMVEVQSDVDYYSLSEIMSKTIYRCTKNSILAFEETDCLDDDDLIIFYYTVRLR